MAARGSHQIDLLSPEVTSIPIRVIGVGGIGSFTVLALAKMGFTNITFYDDDTIEDHNVDNQLYGPVHLGMKKVDALRAIVKILAGINVVGTHARVSSIEQNDGGITIFAVDRIEIREHLFASMKLANGFLIDARMGNEQWTIYTVNLSSMTDRKWYQSFIHPQSESVELPCTAKSIMYTPFSVGGEIAFRVKQIAMNQAYERKKDHAFTEYKEPVAITLS